MVLVIIMILTGIYLNNGPGGGGGGAAGGNPQQKLDAARQTVCMANRTGHQARLIQWSMDHPGQPPTVEALAREGIHLPTCPDGGDYTILGNRIFCTVHEPPPEPGQAPPPPQSATQSILEQARSMAGQQ